MVRWILVVGDLTDGFIGYFAVLAASSLVATSLLIAPIATRFLLRRVRPLERVRWPRVGRPSLWRSPRYEPIRFRRSTFSRIRRRKFPSTLYFSKTRWILLISSPVRSLARLSGLTWHSFRTSSASLGPTPKM